MEYFLERIAKSLYSEFGDDLNSHCLVFPGRRAGLFFMKYLSRELKKPLWTPGIKTIKDLFVSLSHYHQAEIELLLFELYKAYRTVKKTQESFEDFFYWGDMLLSDFDDTDKYLADPSVLFRNVSDLKKIDQQFGDLTPEQVEVIKRFWINFDPGRVTNEKSGFISIWSVIGEIYHVFRTSLKGNNIGYEGMIFRDVAESESWKDPALLKWKMFHFIGFNALNDCEKKLMLSLKKEGRARFYWDYDDSYISGTNLNSAGFFLRKNLKVFGNNMPEDWNTSTLLYRENTRRRVIDSSSDIAQVKLIPDLIGGLLDMNQQNAHETAIILSDENLLMPVLSSLPQNIKEINLTMGFPLRQTPVYTVVEKIFELQRNARLRDGEIFFSGTDSINIIRDTFISKVTGPVEHKLASDLEKSNTSWVPSSYFTESGLLSGIFIKATTEIISDVVKNVLSLVLSIKEDDEETGSNSILSRRNIRNEFIYRILLLMNRLNDAIKRSGIAITPESWMRILDRLLRSQSIPFSGEPLSGLQIMGILETRALDFKNIILLSVNEGIFPSSTSSSSFIPYSLRTAFGLPSVNHQESVFAYHFYRLLHRAENVTFIYNSNPDGLKTGEMSRFLQQMKYDAALRPEFISAGFGIKNPETIGTSVERTEEHTRQLLARTSGENGIPYLSSSAVNTWLFCRMKFYYRYVNGIPEPAGGTTEIDPAMLGTLLHDVMKKIYEPHSGVIINESLIDELLTSRDELELIIEQSLNENFRGTGFHIIAGNELIVKDVLRTYVERIMKADKTYSPFKIIGVEKSFRFPVKISPGNGVSEITAGGRMDRIDMKGGITRIVDYKTGAVEDSIAAIDELFTDDRDKDLDGWLQALFYSEGYLVSNPGALITPYIYKIKKSSGELPEGRLELRQRKSGAEILDNYNDVRESFLIGLKLVIRNIFSPDESFVMTSKRWNKCGYCPYRILCMR